MKGNTMARQFVKIDGVVVDHEGAQAGLDLAKVIISGFANANRNSIDAQRICQMLTNNVNLAQNEMYKMIEAN